MGDFKDFLQEAKIKMLTYHLVFPDGGTEEIYTVSDGKQYALSKDKSVFFWNDKKHIIMKVDGVPQCKTQELFVMKFKNKLGLYDQNMKLIQKFDDIDDAQEYIHNEELDVEEWSN